MDSSGSTSNEVSEGGESPHKKKKLENAPPQSPVSSPPKQHTSESPSSTPSTSPPQASHNQALNSPPSPAKPKNAFSELMSSKPTPPSNKRKGGRTKKATPPRPAGSTTSRFAECTKCHKSIAIFSLNTHIDECKGVKSSAPASGTSTTTTTTTTSTPPTPPTPPTSTTSTTSTTTTSISNNDQVTPTIVLDDKKNKRMLEEDDSEGDEQTVTTNNHDNATATTTTKPKNVFTLLAPQPASSFEVKKKKGAAKSASGLTLKQEHYQIKYEHKKWAWKWAASPSAGWITSPLVCDELLQDLDWVFSGNDELHHRHEEFRGYGSPAQLGGSSSNIGFVTGKGEPIDIPEKIANGIKEIRSPKGQDEIVPEMSQKNGTKEDHSPKDHEETVPEISRKNSSTTDMCLNFPNITLTNTGQDATNNNNNSTNTNTNNNNNSINNYNHTNANNNNNNNTTPSNNNNHNNDKENSNHNTSITEEDDNDDTITNTITINDDDYTENDYDDDFELVPTTLTNTSIPTTTTTTSTTATSTTSISSSPSTPTTTSTPTSGTKSKYAGYQPPTMQSYADEHKIAIRPPHKNLPPWQPVKKPTTQSPGPTSVSASSWSTKFTLKERSVGMMMEVILACDIPESLGGVVDWNSMSLDSNKFSYKCYMSPSLLKSMLQKNVRLSRPWPAVRIALHLIRMDFNNFVRRLSIIVIEDCILHPMLPLVLWLTAASAYNFTPRKQHINMCLTVVYQIAACSKRDTLDDYEMPLRDLTLDEINSLPPLEASLVKSLFARLCFGGMQGDITMLKKYMMAWFERFSGNVPVPDSNTTWRDYLVSLYSQIEAPISFGNVGCIMPDDFVLSGVDFHCSDIIEVLLAQPKWAQEINSFLTSQYGPQVDVQKKLKSMMWNFRSSINTKDTIFPEAEPQIDPKLDDLWKIIRDEVDNIAFQMLFKKLL